jgi:hypothetical protein
MGQSLRLGDRRFARWLTAATRQRKSVDYDSDRHEQMFHELILQPERKAVSKGAGKRCSIWVGECCRNAQFGQGECMDHFSRGAFAQLRTEVELRSVADLGSPRK